MSARLLALGIPAVLIDCWLQRWVIIVCVGPPDSVLKGSATDMPGGKPAAYMGDSTAHGGQIAIGCPAVMIGG